MSSHNDDERRRPTNLPSEAGSALCIEKDANELLVANVIAASDTLHLTC